MFEFQIMVRKNGFKTVIAENEYEARNIVESLNNDDYDWNEPILEEITNLNADKTYKF